jgi:hypothetical protein
LDSAFVRAFEEVRALSKRRHCVVSLLLSVRETEFPTVPKTMYGWRTFAIADRRDARLSIAPVFHRNFYDGQTGGAPDGSEDKTPNPVATVVVAVQYR